MLKINLPCFYCVSRDHVVSPNLTFNPSKVVVSRVTVRINAMFLVPCVHVETCLLPTSSEAWLPSHLSLISLFAQAMHFQVLVPDWPAVSAQHFPEETRTNWPAFQRISFSPSHGRQDSITHVQHLHGL